MRRFILESWLQHEKDIIPAYAFPAYARDHRLTFYAGAGAVLQALSRAIKPEEGKEVDTRVLRDLLDEMSEFVNELSWNLPKAHNAKNN